MIRQYNQVLISKPVEIENRKRKYPDKISSEDTEGGHDSFLESGTYVFRQCTLISPEILQQLVVLLSATRRSENPSQDTPNGRVPFLKYTYKYRLIYIYNYVLIFL